MRAVRQAFTAAAVRLGEQNDEVKRTNDVVAHAQSVQRALTAYCDKLKDVTPTSPFSEGAVEVRTEVMQTHLAQPVAGLADMTRKLTERIMKREELAAELAHYMDKVGRLQADATSAKPKDKEDAKHKLQENQSKLSAAMETHSKMREDVAHSLECLDADISAFLTPTLLQIIKSQMTFHTDIINYYNSALETVTTTKTTMPAKRTSAASGLPQVAPLAPPNAAPAATTSGAPASDTVYQVEADYEAASEGDLNMRAGDLILVLQKHDSGWWDARNAEELGVCPSNYLTQVPNPVAKSRRAAKFAYSSDDSSELSFEKGVVLDILSSMDPKSPAGARAVESGWLLARVGTRVGFVPANYLEDAAATAAPSPAPATKPAPTAAASSPSPAPAPAPAPAAARTIPVVTTPAPAPIPAPSPAPAPQAAKPIPTTAAPTTPAVATSATSSAPTSARGAAPAPVPTPAPAPAPVPAPASTVVRSAPVSVASNPAVSSAQAAVKRPSPAPAAPPAAAPASATAGGAPPDGDAFWTDPQFTKYAKLTKMGMPWVQVAARMQMEGVAWPAGKAASSPAPAAGRAAPPAAPAAAARPAPSAPRPPAAVKSDAADDHPSAAPSALLAGIQGFKRSGLKHAETVEKGVSVPTAATAGGATPQPSGPTRAAAPAPAAPMSMLDEMRARQAKRGQV